MTPPKQLDFEIIEGLGKIEEDVVEELADSMTDVDKDDVWECLRRDDGVQGNAVKVAYMLLRDKRRLGKDREWCFSSNWLLADLCVAVAEFAEAERDAQLAAMDVRLHLILGSIMLITITSYFFSHGTRYLQLFFRQ